MTVDEARELTKNDDSIFIIPRGATLPDIMPLFGTEAITLIFECEPDWELVESVIKERELPGRYNFRGHNKFITLCRFEREIATEKKRVDLIAYLKKTFKKALIRHD